VKCNPETLAQDGLFVSRLVPKYFFALVAQQSNAKKFKRGLFPHLHDRGLFDQNSLDQNCVLSLD
jgi:hypothetical protein